MTSRELTSGFDFWSRGHLHMNRIESGRPIRIRIESGSFTGPYQKATYAACEPVFLAVTEI